MKNSKFLPLYETIYNRFAQGSGFLEGDVVKFKDGYKKLKSYVDLPENIKIRLDDAEISGYNLRVGRLHTQGAQYGSYGHINLPATHADIYQERAPGSFGNLVTVPVDILQSIDTGVNLPPVSKKNKPSKNEEPYQQPTEASPNKDAATDEQTELGQAQTHAKKGNYELGKKDKKPAVGANSYDDSKPSNFKPLPKNKKLVKEYVEDMENVYMSILNEDVQGEAKNHMGERSFKTYDAWKRACKAIRPDTVFTGDKDIDGCELGEWDGAEGCIYDLKGSKADSEKSDS